MDLEYPIMVNVDYPNLVVLRPSCHIHCRPRFQSNRPEHQPSLSCKVQPIRLQTLRAIGAPGSNSLIMSYCSLMTLTTSALPSSSHVLLVSSSQNGLSPWPRNPKLLVNGWVPFCSLIASRQSFLNKSRIL